MRFETKDDLNNELEIINKISRGNKFIKLGPNDIDFLIIDKAYIEIKKYNYYSFDLNFFFVSLIKLVKMQAKDRVLPCYLFLQFIDNLFYIRCIDLKGYVSYTGRKRRDGSTNDKELILLAEKNNFKIFK